MSNAGKEKSKHLLTFRVADEVFALPANAVREVIRLPKVTRVPHGPESLLGVSNLRGNVLPIVALGPLVGLPSLREGRVIVLEQVAPVGIFVDAISAVIDENQEADLRVLDIEQLLDVAFVSGSSPNLRQRGVAKINPSIDEVRSEIDLLVFAVGNQEYALPVLQIAEVSRLPDNITTLPRADDVVVGTIARQGRLLPLLSLQHLLGLKAADLNQSKRVVVCRIGVELVGLVVDAIRSVMRIDEALIDIVPDVLLRGQAEARIRAICRLDGGKRLISILASSHLVNAELTNRLMQHKGEEEDTLSFEDEVTGDQFLVFQLGEQDFGVPIEAVAEVTTLPSKLTKLPKTPTFIEGVMNLRGEIIAVVDQRRRFHGEGTSGKRQRVVVTSLGDMKIGFSVDSVSEVLRIPPDSIRVTPRLGDERTRVFDRIANIGDGERIILLVDPRELLDRAEQDMVAEMTSKENVKGP